MSFISENYEELYNWSIRNYAEFWSMWWEFGNFIYSSPASCIVSDHGSIADKPKWFVGAELNFAENLLRFRDDRIAIIGAGLSKALDLAIINSRNIMQITHFSGPEESPLSFLH